MSATEGTNILARVYLRNFSTVFHKVKMFRKSAETDFIAKNIYGKEKESVYQHGLKYLPVKRPDILNMAIVLVKALLR